MLLQLEHIFPSTIHPMVVHFTIAIIYLAGLSGIASILLRKSDFFIKMFWLLIVLSFLSTIAAGAAGVISESYISQYPKGANQVLHDHKQFAVLTGIFVSIALIIQSWSCYRTLREMKPSWIAVIAMVLSIVFVSMTGHLGGTAVYHYGVGVK